MPKFTVTIYTVTAKYEDVEANDESEACNNWWATIDAKYADPTETLVVATAEEGETEE